MINKIKDYVKDNTGFLLRLDDIAENMKWEFMEKIEIYRQTISQDKSA